MRATTINDRSIVDIHNNTLTCTRKKKKNIKVKGNRRLQAYIGRESISAMADLLTEQTDDLLNDISILDDREMTHLVVVELLNIFASLDPLMSHILQ